MPYSYVALPYSSGTDYRFPHKEERKKFRYRMALRYIYWAASRGEHVICTIAMTHEPAELYGMPDDAGYWYDFNLAVIEKAASVTLLMLPGWKDSMGVRAELELAQSLKLPIRYITPVPDRLGNDTFISEMGFTEVNGATL